MTHPGVGLLRQRLAARAPRRLHEPDARRAAVLVPLVGEDAELQLICFERTHEVLEHKGEICFPGGSIEPHDADEADAALREAHEELGLPREAIEIIGSLDDVHTVASSYVITPIVGHLKTMPQLVLDPIEVARPVVVSLEQLRAPGAEGMEWREWRGTQRQIFHYPVSGGRIWGATGRILHDLLTVWAGNAVRS